MIMTVKSGCICSLPELRFIFSLCAAFVTSPKVSRVPHKRLFQHGNTETVNEEPDLHPSISESNHLAKELTNFLEKKEA